MARFNVIGYNNQIIGVVDAVDSVEAWSNASKMFDNILDVRQVEAPTEGETTKEISRLELFDKEQEANAYLGKKGIRTACQYYRRLFGTDKDGKMIDLTEAERNAPNILYVGTKKAVISTPITEEYLEKAKQSGQLLAEIPFAGESEYPWAIIKAAEIVKAKLGIVTLADVVDISYADKGEIKKLITRLKKSNTEAELKARGEELQDIINQYEERANDTENDDLQEKFQSIVEALENGQQALEKGDKESAISEIEEALFQ